MCHPAADRLSGQAGLRTPSADYSPTGDSKPLETYGVWPSASGLLVPALAQTVFDAGRRRAISESARANYDAAVATYGQTSLTAFQQVDGFSFSFRFFVRIAGLCRAASGKKLGRSDSDSSEEASSRN
jgi:hypothetical protein